MSFEWSDITIRRDYGEYAIAFNSSSLHLVTLSMDTGSVFVIGNFTKPEHFPLSHFEQVVASVERRARDVAASESFGKFMDEATAYVRARVSASGGYYDPDDADWWESTLADIRDGLKMALRETDTYRAARSFDSCVRCLEADIEIIDLIEPILSTFNADTDAALGSWVEKAAESEQTMVRRRNQFVSSAIDRLHGSISGPVMARP
jgi:hypothetical protein